MLPARFVAPARAHLLARGPLASTLAQPALAELLASGRYGAHIRRSRRIYALRLAALMGEAERLRPWLRFAPAEAGLHVVADLAPELSARHGDERVAAALEKAGVSAAPLSRFLPGRRRAPASRSASQLSAKTKFATPRAGWRKRWRDCKDHARRPWRRAAKPISVGRADQRENAGRDE